MDEDGAKDRGLSLLSIPVVLAAREISPTHFCSGRRLEVSWEKEETNIGFPKGTSQKAAQLPYSKAQELKSPITERGLAISFSCF